MSRAVRLVVVAAAALAAWYAMSPSAGEPGLKPRNPAVVGEQAGAARGRAAFTREASGTLMHVSGRVVRLLADDRDGSRHQRFIIMTGSGVSLLIAHNIDLAPRLNGLAVGESVEVHGEYQWNDKGGLIHWTHKDPGGNHSPGYIEWRGRRYQ